MLDPVTQQELVNAIHRERLEAFARRHRLIVLNEPTERRLTIRPLLARLGRQMVAAGEYLQTQYSKNNSRTLQTSVRS